ncbi:discoidin domain-containing protein [Blastococcus sp. VKM Ac-2987]|uniref:discoidin domain-containing protein n=1 Tax=Blastococcus sp. VKM Ac-2987 TaxID=3004141 RepID=UPI0022AB8E27|nr:discoidin domain-containing protein [Blastococcus sp. VKM Ac-2987]MCZ2858477.1 discoidin domain-containing protein [Blastococcus sp. VKM Ac-2987]
MGGTGPRNPADDDPRDLGGEQPPGAPDPSPPAAPPPPLGAPPPWPAPAPPVTPVYSVGPQAWLAEDAPAPAVPPPPPPPPTRQQLPRPPLPRPTRELPAQGPQPGAGPPPGAPLVGPRRREWPVGLLVATAVALVVVVAGGFFVAGLFPTSSDGSGAGDPVAQDGGAATEGGTDTAAGTEASAPLQPVSVRATCQAPPSVDASGNTVTYEPALTLDGVGATAWRCAGSAVGQQLVYDFGAPVTLTSVALVPGYAKVDPADGTDRFLENRTVTEAVWRFDDGQLVRQPIGSPTATAAGLELPGGVTTRQVVLEIGGTGNDAAIRNFTAISDVRFAGY